MNFHLGCAVWAYKGWVGELFPPETRQKDFLSLYSRRFTTVEGNTTFYAVPNTETLARWVAETPEGFEFCLKLPRDLTHNGMLEASIEGTLAFVDQMRGLGKRLGPIFAQLPPSYSPVFMKDLQAFLQAFPRQETPLALEVRHRDWFKKPYASRLEALLAELGVGRVLLDSRPIYNCPDDPQVASERKKPQLPLQPMVTAPFSLIRFISHPDPQYNQAFLQEWVNWVGTGLNQGTKIYFFVHCPVEDYSPGNARNFQQLLEANQVPVSPLPWNQLNSEPTQLNLF